VIPIASGVRVWIATGHTDMRRGMNSLADAYAGFGRLYEANRKGGPIIEAACWAHGRRKFFDLARLSKAPIAAEAVKRVDVLFAIEREINGLTAQERLRVRRERSRPLIVELEAWLREQRAKLSRNNDTTKAINYCLSRWDVSMRRRPRGYRLSSPGFSL